MKVVKHVTVIFLLICLYSAGNAQDAWQPPVDLQLMIGQMKENFPKLKELDQLEKNFQFRRNLARGALFPIVGSSLNYQYQVPVNEITVGPEEIPVFPNHNYSVQVYVTHPIWDFGKTKANMDKVENEQRQLLHNVEL